MRIGRVSNKAQVFINGKWSGWMDRAEAWALEVTYLYGQPKEVNLELYCVEGDAPRKPRGARARTL